MDSAWAAYSQLRELHDKGDYSRSLKLIADTREETSSISSFVACVESSCLERLGNASRGREVLLTEVSNGTNNFWVFLALAQNYRNAGMMKEATEAYQKAHTALGWAESEEKGYIFTHDYFCPNIPNWIRWFGTEIKTAPINILEIGSWQGGSSTFFLDRVVSKRGGTLTCLDTFEGSSEHIRWLHKIGDKLENIFDHNIKATGHAALCRKIVGDSKVELKKLPHQSYDLIYIDGAHEARFVIQDAILSWPLIRNQGYLLFDDTDWKCAESSAQDTIHGIRPFTQLFSEQIRIVEEDRQLLLQKLSD